MIEYLVLMVGAAVVVVYAASRSWKSVKRNDAIARYGGNRSLAQIDRAFSTFAAAAAAAAGVFFLVSIVVSFVLILLIGYTWGN